MWYEALGHGRGSHGCGATDYCIVGRGGRAPGIGRDFAITHRAGEPSGAGPHYFGVSRRAFGLAVARAMRVSQQTVTRCLERAAELGVLVALDDRARPGLDARITAEARTWLVGLACAKPTELGYPHELWTTRLLAAHARNHGPRAGHSSLANLAQGTVCKILAAHEVKPHKVRYYLERRDPEFEPKMAEVLCVYREVAMRRAEPGGAPQPTLAVISYDEKPGIQAIGAVAPDRRPVPGVHPTISRDHEYKRHRTVTLMAGIDLANGQVHALVEDRHRSREFIEFLNMLDAAYPAVTAIKNDPRQSLGARLAGDQGLAGGATRGALSVRVHAQARLLAQSRRGLLRQSRPLRALPHPVCSKHELKQRILEFIDDLNRDPVVHRWHYQIDTAA